MTVEDDQKVLERADDLQQIETSFVHLFSIITRYLNTTHKDWCKILNKIMSEFAYFSAKNHYSKLDITVTLYLFIR